jgi:hypothetical protein
MCCSLGELMTAVRPRCDRLNNPISMGARDSMSANSSPVWVKCHAGGATVPATPACPRQGLRIKADVRVFVGQWLGSGGEAPCRVDHSRRQEDVRAGSRVGSVGENWSPRGPSQNRATQILARRRRHWRGAPRPVDCAGLVARAISTHGQCPISQGGRTGSCHLEGYGRHTHSLRPCS